MTGLSRNIKIAAIALNIDNETKGLFEHKNNRHCNARYFDG